MSEDQFFVYCITEEGCEESGPCKVGVATSLSKRLSSLQGGNWRPLALAWMMTISRREYALNIEQRILMRLRPGIYGHPGPRRRLKSEWIDASPAEAFAAGNDLLTILFDEAA